jgi:exodeoxyribonuclease VII small subunit
MRQLEATVTDLERGDITLEKSIELYERGEALKKRCETLLREAEMRIEKITLGADGNPAGITPLDA